MNIIIVDDLDDSAPLETPEQRKERITALENNIEEWTKYYFPIKPSPFPLPAYLRYDPKHDIITFPRDPDLAAKQRFADAYLTKLKEDNPNLKIITPKKHG